MRNGIAPALLLGGFLTASVASADLTSEELAQIAKQSIVYITFDRVHPETGATDTVSGTGFLISDEGHVITTAHTLKIPTEKGDGYYEIRNLGGVIGGGRDPRRKFKLLQRASTEADDLALLEFEELDRPTRPVVVCKDTPGPSAGLIAFGFPAGSAFVPVPAAYANDAGRWWQFTAAFTEGMSGSPVFDMSGRVRAVVKSGRGSEAALRWAIPVKYATTWLAQEDTQVQCEGTELVPSANEAGQRSELRIKTSDFIRRGGSRVHQGLEDWGRTWLETGLSPTRLVGLPKPVVLVKDGEDDQHYLVEVTYDYDGHDQFNLMASITESVGGARYQAHRRFHTVDDFDAPMKLLAEEIGEILCKHEGLPTPEYPLEFIVAVFEIQPPLEDERQPGRVKNRVRYTLDSLRLPRMKILDSPDLTDRNALLDEVPEADLLLEGKIDLRLRDTGACIISMEVEVNEATRETTLVFGFFLDIEVTREDCEKFESILPLILPPRIAEKMDSKWRSEFVEKGTL